MGGCFQVSQLSWEAENENSCFSKGAEGPGLNFIKTRAAKEAGKLIRGTRVGVGPEGLALPVGVCLLM